MRLWWEGSSLRAHAWGPGADWLLHRVPHLVGAGDRPYDLPTPDDVVAKALAAAPGLRIGRCDTLLHVLVPTVLAQRVTGGEAMRAWRQLCEHLAEPAPGPPGLVLPPHPDDLAALPYWWFHRLGVERRRADTIIRCARRAAGLERLTELPARRGGPAAGDGLRGRRAWTVGSVMGPVFGDPDAVPVGDFHLRHTISWAMAGEPRGTDERMLELLAPYAGQRGRVIRALLLAGLDGAEARPPATHPTHRSLVTRGRSGVPGSDHDPVVPSPGAPWP